MLGWMHGCGVPSDSDLAAISVCGGFGAASESRVCGSVVAWAGSSWLREVLYVQKLRAKAMAGSYQLRAKNIHTKRCLDTCVSQT
jgi:hypothetical protein